MYKVISVILKGWVVKEEEPFLDTLGVKERLSGKKAVLSAPLKVMQAFWTLVAYQNLWRYLKKHWCLGLIPN